MYFQKVSTNISYLIVVMLLLLPVSSSFRTARCTSMRRLVASLPNTSTAQRIAGTGYNTNQHLGTVAKCKWFSTLRRYGNAGAGNNNNNNDDVSRKRLRKVANLQPYDDEAIIRITENWVHKWVFRLGLCPWSGKVLVDGRMKLVLQRGHSLNDLDLNHITDRVLQESLALAGKVHGNNESQTSKAETTLVILPEMEDFDDYLNLHEYLEDILAEEELDEDIQIATFHPKYQFANTKKSDVENYTNRSPYPIFHLLKVQQVSEAIESVQGDTETVWNRNIETMKSLGIKKIKEIRNQIVQEAFPQQKE